ncbi:STAS domain-containing protein [Streptomyces sp. NPDC015242]|uniref:STAS domain-containing protein n=1 Tax=Streptomyces sp. NPDC015242 TaxID=3364951 RepID=UPI003700D84F
MPWNETAAPARTSSRGTSLPQQATGHTSCGTPVQQYGQPGAWVVVARGAYDMDSIAPLAEALETAARNRPKVVLDASGVTFADSTFLNLLIRTHRAAPLRVVAPSDQVRRLCEITGVDGLLELRDTVEDAVAS